MTSIESMFSGFVAAQVAALLTNPIDVVKTNLMVSKDQVFDTYLKCVYFLFQEEGIRAFFRGVLFRSVQVGLISILFFPIYENVLNYTIIKQSEFLNK